MTRRWVDEIHTMSAARLSRALGAFELAPLVDVMLMLVIFSLMVTGFIFEPGIQINLPALANPDAIRGRTMTLKITRERQIYVNESTRPLAMREALSAHLREFARHSPEGRVVIKADYAVSHGYLLELMELIRDNGLRRIAFGSDEAAAATAVQPSSPTTPD
jgi:biopolymer transport protein ExbD